MNLELDVLVGIVVAAATGGAALGKLGDTLWKRSGSGSSHRPPIPACVINPQDIADVRRVITAEHANGYPRVWNNPDTERSIRTTADQVSQQTPLLKEIRDLLRGAR